MSIDMPESAPSSPSIESVTAKIELIKSEIANVTHIPLAEHGAKFHEIHRELSETLSAVEGL